MARSVYRKNSETVEEVLWLLSFGESPWQIAKALRVELASIERAFDRAGIPIPWLQGMDRRTTV